MKKIRNLQEIHIKIWKFKKKNLYLQSNSIHINNYNYETRNIMEENGNLYCRYYNVPSNDTGS